MINKFIRKRGKILNPFFSIILPVYNVEAYLEECMESILQQSFRDFELILVDDGSIDSSPMICDKYKEKYPDIKVIHKDNGGLSSARNIGLEEATGQYVFWVDSDDWIHDHCLESIYSAIKEKKPDIVQFGYQRMPEGKTFIPKFNGSYDKDEIESILIPSCFKETVIFSIWSHVYKRDFIINNHLSFVSERIVGSEDYLYNFEAYICANKIYVINSALYYYRLREGSLTNQGYRPKHTVQYRNLYLYIKKMLIDIGEYDKYKNLLSYFYVWKSFKSSIRNECKISSTHSRRDAKKAIIDLLSSTEFKEAMLLIDQKGYPCKKRIIFLCMKYKITGLLIYIHRRSM